MGYVRAEEVLPAEIIELIQQYVDGTNIYVPRREDNHIAWGQASGARGNLDLRDERIYKEYLEGCKVSELAERYFLSEKSVWRILRKMRSAV